MNMQLMVTGGVLALLVLGFLGFFLIPGIQHWRRLRRLLKQVQSLPKDADLNDLKKVFAADRQLAHLWAEYADSLHPQHAIRNGRQVVVAIRSTLPAEAYFCAQYVVDTPLRTEFFKHLPGIFTGVGIIGTFWGLILGLEQFHVDGGPAAVRTGLKSLMDAVGHAFLISAAAITAAMVVTFIEKMLLVSLYRLTEEIAHAIDKRFETGVTEEYLSRTAQASESAATQAAVLKDALVKDLGDLLKNMVDRQSQAITQSIQSGLAQPLAQITNQLSGAIQQATGNQSAAAGQMLAGLLASFQAQLQTLFGQQIGHINGLNQQTAQTMQGAVQALNDLVQKMQASGEATTTSMDQVSQVMAGSVDKLSAATTTSIDKMHAGAERLDAAATRFASAGNSVSQVMEKAAGVSAQLTQVSGALTSGSVSLGEVLRDYQEQRQAMGQLLGEMRSLVEIVRREGSMTADALKRIEASAERLSEAHKAADAYLDGVSRVLGDSSAAFRESVTSTLGQVNGQFHADLSRAVNLLSGAVQELETALGSFNPKPKG
jgi:ABC-type transporter Mla subunit MlaD